MYRRVQATAAASQEEEEEELEAATTAQFFMATAQCHSLSQVDAVGVREGGREGGRVKALDALIRAHIFSYSGSRSGGAAALALEERMLPRPQSGLNSIVDDSESLLPLLLGLGRGRDVGRARGEAEEVG
jgi:hypothetical protein